MDDEELPVVSAGEGRRLRNLLEKKRLEVKREYFEKVKSQSFWDAVVLEDGPEGVDYAKQTLACIQAALEKRSSPMMMIERCSCGEALHYKKALEDLLDDLRQCVDYCEKRGGMQVTYTGPFAVALQHPSTLRDVKELYKRIQSVLGCVE